MRLLAQGLEQLLYGDFAGATRVAGGLAGGMHAAGFDAEAATNLLALLSAIVAAGGELQQGPESVRALGLRFCVSMHTTEVLARACDGAQMYAGLLRTAHAEIGEATRGALSGGLAGRLDGVAGPAPEPVQPVQPASKWLARLPLNGA